MLALDTLVDHLSIGQLLREHGLEPAVLVGGRDEVFDLAIAQLGEGRVHYLEFGVSTGESMAYWSARLRNEAAVLHGFDHFTGLPEDCSPAVPQGSFDAGGLPPEIDDPRIVWHLGWFDDVLPSFELPPHDRLFVNVDCDLHSSTSSVLAWALPRLAPGDLLYFDELEDRAHEGRAFHEQVLGSDVELSCVAATRDLSHVLFRVERALGPGRR